MPPGQLNPQDAASHLVTRVQIPQREFGTVMVVINYAGILPSTSNREKISCGSEKARWNRNCEFVDTRAQCLVRVGYGIPEIGEEYPCPLHVLNVEC
jgi:hypothetical protein